MFERARLAGDADRVAPAGAADQGPRGRGGARGRVPAARREAAEGRARDRDRPRRRQGVRRAATTAAPSTARTRCSRIGSIPNSEGLGLRRRGRRGRRRRLHPGQPPLPDERPAHLLRRRRVGQAAAVVGGGDAGPQDRRARDGAHRRAAPPPRLRQGRVRRSSPIPRSPTSGVAEAEAFAAGRKLRVTKVPFSANPKALINGDTRGFVKILSDPATGVVLGGVDRRAQRGRADLA